MRKTLSMIMLASALQAVALSPDEALKFLYSTLSLPDKTDYSEDFYRRNVETSLRTREEMLWGAKVPDREFLHFVLPVRVNNENLDYSREVFYDALKERVKGLSMKDAILEVNHWCHEKATYRPSDARTSSPLSTVSQAIGRCGEESTFTVAALRAVGIPARQIYTPRWAHTDDNHAWVEAWADGEWYFLGACEPEAVLNLAWFNAPASRGLLMNTNVAGDYDGPEEVLLKEPLVTRINVTANYAPVATLPVKVVDTAGNPVKGAKVNFCIYNYAEYYPAVSKIADDEGETSLTSGLGDMVVWATDGRKFGFAKGSAADYVAGSGEPLRVVLDKDSDYEGSVEYTIVPPRAATPLPVVTDEQRNLNDRRLAREDSIRNAYSSTFATPEQAAEVAARLGLDREKIIKILTESRGNHRTLTQALETMDPMRRDKVVDLLMQVSEKDRRDITIPVIHDHVVNVIGYALDPDDNNMVNSPDFLGMEKVCFDSHVLNPRIENEGLTAWRSVLVEEFTPDKLTEFRKNPKQLVDWVKSHITVSSDDNPQRLRMSPEGVLRQRRADSRSRDIFFVALARTSGLPSRIDPVTGKTQYAVANPGKEGEAIWYDWMDADLDGSEPEDASGATESGSVNTTLTLSFIPEGFVADPKYYSQFTISKITDGIPHLLEYPEEATVSEIFATPQQIEPGQYILTSGQRLADGGVLSRSEIFKIEPGMAMERKLIVRQDPTATSVIGSVNAENIYHDLATATDKSLLSTTGRGYYVMALVSPGHEPSAHALNDISAVGKDLEATGVKIMTLFADKERASRFDRSLFPSLPSNVVLGIDNNGVSRKEILESLHLSEADDPVIVIADTFNRIVWVQTGYSIGTGERLLSTLRSLK